MSNEPDENGYEAPQVSEEQLDSGGNYVASDAGQSGMGTLGDSSVDPQ